MAALGRDDGFGRRTGDNATRAVDGQRRRNHDGIDRRSDDLNAKAGGRSQIYRGVGFIEAGFRQVWAGHGRDADCGCQQDENQSPTKSLHVTLPQETKKIILRAIGCQWRSGRCRKGREEARYPRRSSAFPQRMGREPATSMAGNASLLNRIETYFHDAISAVDKNF
jgi:hypothetical protein